MVCPGVKHDELCQSIGKFIISFSKVDSWLVNLLGELVDGEGNLWIKPYFIDDMMLGRIRGKISTVAKDRLRDNQPILKRLRETLSQVQEVIKERNNIVHGEWLIDATGRCPARLRTYKPRWENDCWQYLDDKQISYAMLRGLIRQSETLATNLEEITAAVQTYKITTGPGGIVL